MILYFPAVQIHTNRAYWRTIMAMVLLYGLASFLQVLVQGTGEESVRIMIRYSAKGSVLLFSLAFSAGAIHHILKEQWSAVLLKLRPHLGLAFMVSHSFHLLYLIWLQQVIHPVFTLAKGSSLFAGGMAYFLMYLMAITTFDTVKSKLDQRTWRVLHLLGGYWIWGVFFNSYLKNVLYRDRYHGLLIMLSLVMLLRIWRLITRHSKERAALEGPDRPT